MASPSGLEHVHQECPVPRLSAKAVGVVTERAWKSIPLQPGRPCLCPHRLCAWASYSALPQLTHTHAAGLSEGMELNKCSCFDYYLLSAFCVLGGALIPFCEDAEALNS